MTYPLAAKLETAAFMSISLREQRHLHGGKLRKVRTESGKELSTVELAERVAEKAKIDLATQEGVKPKYIECRQCGAWFERRVRPHNLTSCPDCRSGGGQTVCAGACMRPCPDAVPVPINSFSPSKQKRRRGGPWRCKICALRHAHSTDLSFLDHRCAGGCGAIAPTYAFQRSHVARRNGSPWICAACGHKKSSATRLSRRIPRPKVACAGACDRECPRGASSVRVRVDGDQWRCVLCASRQRRHSDLKLREQSVCAGSLGNDCPQQRRPPAKSFSPHAVARRHGEPWRCLPCARRHQASKRKGAR
jgi:hypothetical protein